MPCSYLLQHNRSPNDTTPIITIDGGGGGGQILRTSLALAALSGKPVGVGNIRGGRPKPGLQPQHLLGVKSLGEVCGAQIKGAELGSVEVEFVPGPLKAREHWRLEMGTAGSTTLLLQSLLPCLATAPQSSSLTLTGGTNNPFAPPADYFQHLFLPALKLMGITAALKINKRGFYPKGGGEVEVTVARSGELRPIEWTERGDLERIWGISYSRNLPAHIAERMAQAARQALVGTRLPVPEITLETEGQSPGPGCGLILFADFTGDVRLGADALGERGKKAEAVGEEATQALLEEIRSEAPVDRHLGDQLPVWVALAPGRSRYLASCLTDHLRSVTEVTQTILGCSFTMEGAAPVMVTCSGRSAT